METIREEEKEAALQIKIFESRTADRIEERRRHAEERVQRKQRLNEILCELETIISGNRVSRQVSNNTRACFYETAVEIQRTEDMEVKEMEEEIEAYEAIIEDIRRETAE